MKRIKVYAILKDLLERNCTFIDTLVKIRDHIEYLEDMIKNEQRK